MTTNGSHKAEEAATQSFCDERGSGKELQHLRAPAIFYSIIFSMSTFMMKTNMLWCYIITPIYLNKVKTKRKRLFSHCTTCFQVLCPDLEALTRAADCSYLHFRLKRSVSFTSGKLVQSWSGLVPIPLHSKLFSPSQFQHSHWQKLRETAGVGNTTNLHQTLSPSRKT